MDDRINLSRRKALWAMALTGAVGFGGFYAGPANAQSIGAMMPGKGWLKQGAECGGDGTPLQFIPKNAPDAEPLQDELTKYPKCPYCGMDRKMWNYSRHLVHYDDGLADGTCSLHCLAISLALNLDRGIRAIYVADFGSANKVKPLLNVEDATYLLGSDLPGTMSKESKMAFSTPAEADTAKTGHGGKAADFDEALSAAYLGMARDTAMIRKRRAAKRKKMKS